MLTNRVTVVIPFFNDGRYLRETINSVKKQTHKVSEIIVVDDGSYDSESMNILDTLKSDAEIKVFHKNNGGLASARNFGIANAESEFIVPLDADDLLQPSFVECCLAQFDSDPVLSIVATEVKLFGTKNASMSFPKITKTNMLVMNCLVATAMFRREAWESVNGYNENMTFGYEDWDFWLSCIEIGLKFHRIQQELFFYRIKEKSMILDLLNDSERKNLMKNQLRLNHEKLYATEKANIFRETYLKTKYIFLNQGLGSVLSKILSTKSGSNRSQA